MTKRADWETQAHKWVAWVRKPGHDSYAQLREPAVPPEAVEADPSERRWARIPQSLFLRAVKLD